MEKDWVVIHTTKQIYISEMIRDILEQSQIASVVLNKMDSSYLNFGEIEILVKASNVILSKHIIDKMDLD